jgi:hypothetical protein
MEHGVVFARLRERAVRGEDPSLAYFGWSPEFEKPSDVPLSVASDPEVWAQANPALGIRITTEHVAMEQRSMDPRTFAVERLGVGDWPRVTGEDGAIISIKQWLSLVDPQSGIDDRPVFAFDVSPDRSSAAVGVAGFRDDGLAHVEIAEHKRGTGWLVDYLAERVAKHHPSAVVCAQRSPAASMVTALENAGVTITRCPSPITPLRVACSSIRSTRGRFVISGRLSSSMLCVALRSVRSVRRGLGRGSRLRSTFRRW